MIPPDSSRVFTGELFDIYQWEQQLFDGSFARFERAKRKTDTVQVIAITVDGMIVVVDEEQPGSVREASIPGGRVDLGEEPQDAARRELLEETGYEAQTVRLFRTYDRFPKVEWNVHYFIAHGVEPIGEPTPDAGERIKVRLLSIEEFLEKMTEPNRDDGAFTADMLRVRYDKTERSAFLHVLGR